MPGNIIGSPAEASFMSPTADAVLVFSNRGLCRKCRFECVTCNAPGCEYKEYYEVCTCERFCPLENIHSSRIETIPDRNYYCPKHHDKYSKNKNKNKRRKKRDDKKGFWQKLKEAMFGG
jgi:hypothetical protein